MSPLSVSCSCTLFVFDLVLSFIGTRVTYITRITVCAEQVPQIKNKLDVSNFDAFDPSFDQVYSSLSIASVVYFWAVG